MSDAAHNPPYPFFPNGWPVSPPAQTPLGSYVIPIGPMPNDGAQPFHYVRRIIDLETRVSQLEAALAKMEESK